jgi:hypothetical protein
MPQYCKEKKKLGANFNILRYKNNFGTRFVSLILVPCIMIVSMAIRFLPNVIYMLKKLAGQSHPIVYGLNGVTSASK